MAIESGTPELKRKHEVKEESLDTRGIFRRSRVTDQCVIDRFFLDKKISVEQYSAGEMYMGLLWKAGTFLRSPSLEREIETKGRDVEKSLSSRIMVISKARSVLRDRCSSDVMLAVDICIGGNRPVDLVLLRTGLNVLAKHFGLKGMQDPREI